MAGQYACVYLRRSFEVSAAAAVSSLQLAVDYDDSFVAYLNGREIARSNLGEPGTPLSRETLATSQHEAGVLEYFDVSAFRGELASGTNVLAIEVHNHSLDSSDLTCNASLDANQERPGTFFDAGFDLGGGKAAWVDFDDDGF